MGDGSSQKPFKSIECAVNNSKDDSTIHLNDGEYAGDSNRNIEIDKSITIIGKSKQGTIINGESSGRLFNVTSTGKLTLINITLVNGYSTGNGGSIYCNGGEVNIKNCIVKNSKVEKNGSIEARNGGAIFNNLGTLNIENSCFINNTACEYGGVLYTLGTTSIKNSNFTGNFLTSHGAVGACIVSGGKIDLDGCLFRDCYAQYAAAGLLNNGNATINNCRFENLSTNYTAGAISNHKYMIINNSYFGYNNVQYYAAAILDITLEYYSAPGGPYVITEVYNTIFEKNYAGYQAAVSNNFPNTYLLMQNCAFLDNYLNKSYGDIGLDDNATVLYCWWGKNEIGPYYSSHGKNEPEKINASRWLVMNFTSNNDAIYRNENNQLTVSLKYYFNNETKEIREYEGEYDLPLDVTFYTDFRNLTTKKLVNGIATLNYKPHEYDEVIYAKINDQILKIENFKVRNTKIIVKDFEKYYGSSSKLTMKLVKDNNVLISNKKLTVSLGGKVYTAKTDANGIAKLTLKIKPKKYTAKITFKGNDYLKSSTKSIKVKIVKPIIKASKLTIRKKGKFVVTFKDAHKKAIKKVKVKFKIKGKTYIRTTNSKGQAKITINLKAGKKYTVKVGFKSTKYYGTTTLTKKIKVIK